MLAYVVLQNNEWIWVYTKCTQFLGNMFVTHTIINVKYSGNQRDMKYFCDSNIFGFISNYFWHLHFWTYCTNHVLAGRICYWCKWPEGQEYRNKYTSRKNHLLNLQYKDSTWTVLISMSMKLFVCLKMYCKKTCFY